MKGGMLQYVYIAQAYTGREIISFEKGCFIVAQLFKDRAKYLDKVKNQEPVVGDGNITYPMVVQDESLLKGLGVYNPVVHWHQAAVKHKLPQDFTAWMEQNDVMLGNASQLWVFTDIEGWRESKGVNFEIKRAIEFKIPIQYLSYDPVLELIRLENFPRT